MIIEIKTGKVKVAGFCLNGEPLTLLIETPNSFGLFTTEKFKAGDLSERNYIVGFPNTFENQSGNEVSAVNIVAQKLKDFGLTESDFQIKADYEPFMQDRPIKLCVSQKAIIETYDGFIEKFKTEGTPYIAHSDYYVCHVGYIEPGYEDILAADINVFVELK